MIQIEYVSGADKSFWLTLDEHLSENEFMLKVRDKRGYVIRNNDTLYVFYYLRLSVNHHHNPDDLKT